MKRIKKIHFVGIKGVGMTPLAIIAKEAGIKVTGSDIAEEFITDEALKKAGITPFVGFSGKNVGDVDLLIATGAHNGFKNIEVLDAKRKGIKVISQGEAVGVFMNGAIFNRKFTGISVTGTHGKTTVSAMIATLLNTNGLDCSYLIGTASAPSLGFPGHYGKGEYFVSEADEYVTEPNFDKTIKHLWQHPKIAVITNIEFDHPDAYKSLDETREKFLDFANQLPYDGVLITCGDDPQVRQMLKNYKGRVITYGFGKENNFVVEDVLKNIELSVFGKHNELNAVAAFAVGREIGFSYEQTVKGLAEFRGSKRRSEFKDVLKSGAKVYDDYAHHPTEIKNTLKAFREKFPKERITCIFQPHTYTRTKSLFEEFAKSFEDVDDVILTDIFASQREAKDSTVSMDNLANKIGPKARYLPKFSDVAEYLSDQSFGEKDIIITMGAGDVYKIHKQICK